MASGEESAPSSLAPTRYLGTRGARGNTAAVPHTQSLKRCIVSAWSSLETGHWATVSDLGFTEDYYEPHRTRLYVRLGEQQRRRHMQP